MTTYFKVLYDNQAGADGEQFVGDEEEVILAFVAAFIESRNKCR